MSPQLRTLQDEASETRPCIWATRSNCGEKQTLAKLEKKKKNKHFHETHKQTFLLLYQMLTDVVLNKYPKCSYEDY